MANIRAKSAPSPSPASGDYLYVVDVSDTTDNAQGSDKADTIANVVTKGHGLSDGIVKVSSGTMAQATDGTDYISSVAADTTPQLGGQLDVNGNAIGDGTNELLTFTEDASAVNHVNIENEATGSGPIIRAAGDDANVDLNIQAKGTGNIAVGNYTFDADATVGAGQDNYALIYDNGTGTIGLESIAGGLADIVDDTTPQLGGQLDVNGNSIGDGTRELLTFTEDASAVNQVNIENEATGSGPIISAAGDDTNIDLNIVGKGTGNVKIGNFTFDGDATVGSGQDNYVLTYDNGAGTIGLEAAAGGGGGTAKHQIGLVKMGMDMIGEGVVTTDSSGTGASVAFATTQGINLNCGTTSSGYARLMLYKNRNNTGECYGVFDRNPNFHSFMALYGADDAEIHLGFGADSSFQITSGGKGFGFKIVMAAGTETVYAINSNGTSVTETDITTAAQATTGWNVAATGYTQLLNAVMTSGTDIKFYINGTLMATHTTNLPSGNLTFTTSNYLFACSNTATTGNTSGSQLWIRDHYVDIDVV